ncbi:MAG: hypothetical protein Q7W56_10495 [Candidatus Latescibacteria bacterium]|nr:hypothetical protein [Candidatus Latescibacterota bacterium]
MTRTSLRWTALPVLLLLALSWFAVQVGEEPVTATSAACCCGKDDGGAHSCCCTPDGGSCPVRTGGDCQGPCGSRASPFTVESTPPTDSPRGELILAGDVTARSRSTAPLERPPIAG